MRAGFGVDALFGQAQALDGTASDEMLFYNRRGVFGLDVAVPDSIGIHDNIRPMLALVEAKRFVDANASAESGVPGQLRKARVQFALPVFGAGGARGAIGTDIMTDEDVTFESGQARILRS